MENIELEISEDDKSKEPTKHNECPANSLPIEVIIYLMEFLAYSDRVAASQVCHLWYEASLHPKFINQEKVVIDKSASEAISVFKKTSRKYFHFELTDIEINEKTSAFWMQVAPDLKSLYFRNCDMYGRVLIKLLMNCYNLESLILNNCRELFMPGRFLDIPDDITALRKSLRHLKELSLCSNRYLSDAILNRLMAAMPYLDSISLERCQISYHNGLFKKYYPDRLTTENIDYASETVLTFRNFYKTLVKQAQTVKSINLSYTLVDSSSLSIISDLKDLQLKELHAKGCEQLTSAALLSLASHQKALTVLDLSCCSRITDQALLHICANLTQLAKLAVRNCRAVTDLGVVHLKNLSNLEELDISHCECVTGKGIEEGLCYKVNTRLKKLLMEGLNTITSNTIISLAEKLPLLTHLNLSFCFNAVTDKSLQAIFQHQKRLRSLKLAHCEAVTDAGLTGMKPCGTIVTKEMGEEPPSRLHISLRSKAEEEIVRDAYRKNTVQRLCEAQIIGTSSDGYSLDQLKGLQELDLEWCNKITDVSLKYAFNLLELQYLNLSHCQQITHEGLSALSKNNPSIDTLNLAHCYNVTDEGVKALTASLHRLKHLDIQACTQLTGESVTAIATNCHHLQYLDVSLNNNLSDKIVELLPRLPTHTFFGQLHLFAGAPPPPPPPSDYR